MSFHSNGKRASGEGKSSVKVVVRIRPEVGKEKVVNRCVFPSTKNSKVVELRNPALKSLPTEDVVCHSLDACYDWSSKQEAIFEEQIAPILPAALQGINATVFAYGNTGAGKTHTMQGTDEDPGIIPRTAERLLQIAKETRALERKARKRKEWKLTCSYLEIYNEKLYDLLATKDGTDLPIRQDRSHNILIPNLTETEFATTKQFEDLYQQGCKNRTTAETKLNKSSSRSHAIIMFKILQRELTAPFRVLTSKIHLIDLAGSEDNRRTENHGIRLTESSNINTSLFVLNKVVNALNDGANRIPYRDSKLTRLLQDSLGGNSYAVLIANVAPTSDSYLHTNNTLNFASKYKHLGFRGPHTLSEKPPQHQKPKLLGRNRKRKEPSNTQNENIPPARHNARMKGGVTKSSTTQPYDIEQEIDRRVEEKLNTLLEQKKQEMLSPWVKKRRLLDTVTQTRLEALERRLMEQAAAKNVSSRPRKASKKQEPALLLRSRDKASVEQSVLSLLNTGSFKDLMTLRGIGAMRANKVLEHRTNGKHSFEKIEDLEHVGFGQKAIQTFYDKNVTAMCSQRCDKSSPAPAEGTLRDRDFKYCESLTPTNLVRGDIQLSPVTPIKPLWERLSTRV